MYVDNKKKKMREKKLNRNPIRTAMMNKEISYTREFYSLKSRTQKKDSEKYQWQRQHQYQQYPCQSRSQADTY